MRTMVDTRRLTAARIRLEALMRKSQEQSLKAHAKGDWLAAAFHADQAEMLREKLRG